MLHVRFMHSWPAPVLGAWGWPGSCARPCMCTLMQHGHCHASLCGSSFVVLHEHYIEHKDVKLRAPQGASACRALSDWPVMCWHGQRALWILYMVVNAAVHMRAE